MKLRLLVSRSGPTLTQDAGEVIDVDDDEARRMIEAGQAVPVKRGKRETATVQPGDEDAG